MTALIPLPSVELLRETFDYEEGVLIRKRTGHRCATLKGDTGYMVVYVDGKQYSSHRVVWKWHHGVDPQHTIDHINGDRADNRIENLQDIPMAENVRKGHLGRGKYMTGVRKQGNRFYARILWEGKQLYSPSCATEYEAHMLYMRALGRLG